MKRIQFYLTVLFMLFPMLGQAQKELFNKYNDMKGVSSVYISKTMLEMSPHVMNEDLYFGKAGAHLNSVQVISTQNDKIKTDMLKDIRALVKSSKYELLMKQKGIVSSSEFYISRTKEKIKELIMIMNGASSLKFIYIEGDMTADDVKKLLYQNTSMNARTFTIPHWQGLCSLAQWGNKSFTYPFICI